MVCSAAPTAWLPAPPTDHPRKHRSNRSRDRDDCRCPCYMVADAVAASAANSTS